MDAISIGWAIAPVVSGLLFTAWALLVNVRAGWACLMVAPLPLAAMGLLSIPGLENMASRIWISGLLGAFAGAIILIGAVEALHSNEQNKKLSEPQKTEGSTDLAQQNNKSGPNIIAPGGNFNIYPPANPPAPPSRPRDPDTIYQLENPVGTVERVSVDLSNGVVVFDLIRGAINLNADRDFQYRNYVLHVTQFAAEMGNRDGPQGRWLERRLARVICRIVNGLPP